MGLLLSRYMNTLFDRLGGSGQERRILMLGLDNAGKTTIMYKLRLGENVHTIPTVGFNCEEIQYKNVKFTMWDIGGQAKLRRLWHHYFQGNDALIFVIDSNDRERIAEAREQLQGLLNEELLQDIILLVFANKADLPNAMDSSSLNETLNLKQMAGHRPWFIQPTCATNGEGLYPGLDWLANTLDKRPKAST